MKKLYIIALSMLLLTLGACASNGVNEVGSGSTNYIMHYKSGTITEVKPVIIKGAGGGGFLGAITGAVLGSTLGGGRGNTLTTLGGGLLGAYAGKQLAKANAQELTVKLNDSGSIVVIAKGKKFLVGQRVRIVTEGGRVVTVEHN